MKIQRHIQCFTTENYPKDTETEYILKIIMGALRISNIRLTYKNIPLVEYIFKNLCKDMDNFEIKVKPVEKKPNKAATTYKATTCVTMENAA